MDFKEVFYQDMKGCKAEFSHIIAEITDSALGKIDELYGAADTLSILNAQKHNRILLILSVLGTLITFSFLLYDEAELHGLILACGVMILFLFITRSFANRLECHRKYIEYRVLAETLRIQFFLSFAGVKTRVSEILPNFIRNAVPWIGEILAELQVNAGENHPVIDFWIKDQKEYHKKALAKSEIKKHRDDNIARTVLITTVIVYIGAILFELFVYNNFLTGINYELCRTVLKIVVGTLSAVTLFTGSYYGKMSLSNIIDDHRRMIKLYENVEKDVLKHGESEKILLSLAYECLVENSTWYAYQNKNKPNIVI